MEIETLRDVVIIVSSLLMTMVMIGVAVAAFVIYGKLSRVLDFATSITAKIEAVTAIISEEISKPLAGTAVLFQGITGAIREIKKIIKKGEK